MKCLSRELVLAKKEKERERRIGVTKSRLLTYRVNKEM